MVMADYLQHITQIIKFALNYRGREQNLATLNEIHLEREIVVPFTCEHTELFLSLLLCLFFAFIQYKSFILCQFYGFMFCGGLSNSNIQTAHHAHSAQHKYFINRR